MRALTTSAAPAKPESTSEYSSCMIVAFGLASITDNLTHTVMPKLSESLGQPVIVDNRPGASGNIGTDITAQSTVLRKNQRHAISREFTVAHTIAGTSEYSWCKPPSTDFERTATPSPSR